MAPLFREPDLVPTTATKANPQPSSPKAREPAIQLPGLLHCLIVSWSQERLELLSRASEKQAWEAMVAKDLSEFLRFLFQWKVPLTIVDLPLPDDATYEQLREAAARVPGVNDSLLVICGAEPNENEELWARQLGAWTYLPEAHQMSGLELVFGEARKAVAQKSTAYIESADYR